MWNFEKRESRGEEFTQKEIFDSSENINITGTHNTININQISSLTTQIHKDNAAKRRPAKDIALSGW